MSRLPHFLDNRLTVGGEVVSLMRRRPFCPQEDSWYSLHEKKPPAMNHLPFRLENTVVEPI
jgi:hypothetical protein